MTQYIDKDVLVAEIDRRIKVLQNNPYENHKTICHLDSLKQSINTLEVKEVDLEKELIKWHKEHFKKDGTFIGMSGFYLTNNSQMDIAKHFFELGIEKSIDESIIRKIVELDNEAVKHYDAVIRKEDDENGFSQLAIDLFEHNVCPKELCIQYVIENLKAKKGE